MDTEKKRYLKFAMMSGALKNAGDFLIVKRSQELIQSVYPNAEFSYFDRCTPLEPYLSEINGMDAMIFCGGPAYLPQLYPDVFPLVKDLNQIQIPMFALGLGWFGSSVANKAVYHYKFNDNTIRLLKRIEADTKILGCRDWYSVKVLRNNGIWSGKMTGCPAWYYLPYLNQESFILSNPYHVKKVCISDPANVASLEKMIDLVAYARQVFPKAETIVVFHRGISADLYTDAQTAQVVQKAIKDSEDLGARCVDISYGADGFSIYDDCDIHIGFRVHAHIYNLSRRNLSILAEEDARGAGVNDALGLEHVTSYDYGIGISYEKECVVATVGKVSNIYFMQMLDDCLNNLYQTDFMQVKNAYKIMKKYHGIIEGHIKGLCKFL